MSVVETVVAGVAVLGALTVVAGLIYSTREVRARRRRAIARLLHMVHTR